MIGILWAYEGWQYVTFSAGETRDPQRVFPRAIAVATAALIFLYIIANSATSLRSVRTPRRRATTSRPTRCARCSARCPESSSARSCLVSIFSAANGVMLTAPRLYYSMARDGVFFARLARVSERFGTPASAIVLLAVWSALLAASGTFEQLLTYVVFAGWIFYGLGAMSVFVIATEASRRAASVPHARLSGDAAAVRRVGRPSRLEHASRAADPRADRSFRRAARHPGVLPLARAFTTRRARRSTSHHLTIARMHFTTQLEERMRTLIDQRLRRRLLILASMALGAVGAQRVARVGADRHHRRSRDRLAFRARRAERRHSDRGHALRDRNERGRPVSPHERSRWVAHADRATHRLLGRRRSRLSSRADREVTLDIALQPGAVALDQVVVTGTAGAQELRSVGNAVSTVDATQVMAQAQPPDISSLLKGSVAGVAILERSGRLGSGPTIQIRGRSSIGLENSPLIYIDGIRVNNATATGPSGAPGGSAAKVRPSPGVSTTSLPDDIESIQVIKGPAAATIYGTEAANGVIQIITKKGASSGRSEFSAQVQYGTLTFRDAENRMPTNYFKDKSGRHRHRGTASNRRTTAARRSSRLVSRVCTPARSPVRATKCATTSPRRYENDYGIEPNNSLRQASVHANVDVAVNSKTDFSGSLNFVNLSEHLRRRHRTLGDVRRRVRTSAAVDGAGGARVLLELPARSAAAVV